MIRSRIPAGSDNRSAGTASKVRLTIYPGTLHGLLLIGRDQLNIGLSARAKSQ